MLNVTNIAHVLLGCISILSLGSTARAQVVDRLDYQTLPDLPDPVGVAGPIVGVHADHLVVAGGANFAMANAPDLWELRKRYHSTTWLLPLTGNPSKNQWIGVGDQLEKSVAYSAVVSTEQGIVVMGGEDGTAPTNRAYLLQVTNGDGKVSLVENDNAVPDLPFACTGGGAAVIGEYVYLVAGQIQQANGVRTASRLLWRLNLNEIDPTKNINNQTQLWNLIPSWPASGPKRMFALVTSQQSDNSGRLYVIGGRRFADGKAPTDETLIFAADSWVFDPSIYDASKFRAAQGKYSGVSPWKRIADAPVPLTAGTAVAHGNDQVLVLAYASGDILRQQLDSGKAMKDFPHPGFNKTAYAYNAATNSWLSLGKIPSNPVTTPAVSWKDDIFLVSGEVSPRVRTSAAWRIRAKKP